MKKIKFLTVFITAAMMVSVLLCVPAMAQEVSAGQAVPVSPYSDVGAGDWFYGDVVAVSEAGIMTGYGDGRFGPYDAVTREQFALMLYRREGCPLVSYISIFDDVPEDAWCTNACIWAYKSGLMTGYGNGCFGVGDGLVRGHALIVAERYASLYGIDLWRPEGDFDSEGRLSKLTDQQKAWREGAAFLGGNYRAVPAVPSWKKDPGLMEECCIRCECAAFLSRLR